MLLKVKEEKPALVTLCGLTPDQTEANFAVQGLGPPDAKLLALELAVHASLTSVDLSQNGLGPAGAKALVDGGAFTGSLTKLEARLNLFGSEGEAALQDAVRSKKGFNLLI